MRAMTVPAAATASGSGRGPIDRVVAALWVAIVAWIAWQYAACATLPLLADDHVHAAAARRWTSLADLFAATPPRPLQHAVAWLGTELGDAGPATMRAIAAGLHLAALALLAAVARGLGLAPRRAAAAAALFATFPIAPTVFWPAAVNSPGRLAATLAVLWAFQEPQRPARALAGLVAAAIALGFHQTAVTLPALVAAQHWALAGGRAASVRAAAGRLARSPAWWLLLALVAAAAVWFRSVPDQHLAPRSWQSVAANGAWFATGLWPESARLWTLDALRGGAGAAAAAGAAALLLATAAGVVAWFARGGAIARFALLAAACDVLPPLLTAGWTQRHMLLSAAVLAVAAVGAATTRPRVLLVAAVSALWLADAVGALQTFREATRLSHRLVHQAAAARAALPAQQVLYVVDVPFAHGAARDVPLGNWGFVDAIAATGARGPVTQLYTRPQPAGTEARIVDHAEVERLRGSATVLEFDPATGALAPRAGSRDRNGR